MAENDFHYIHESLYKTPRGNYFLCGYGGALTRYGEDNGCGMRCGCTYRKIIPIDEDFKLFCWFNSTGNVKIIYRDPDLNARYEAFCEDEETLRAEEEARERERDLEEFDERERQENERAREYPEDYI